MDLETLGAAVILTAEQAAAAEAAADRAEAAVAQLDPEWTVSVTGTKLSFTKEDA